MLEFSNMKNSYWYRIKWLRFINYTNLKEVGGDNLNSKELELRIKRKWIINVFMQS